jgi:hypothetical protein
MNPKLDPTPVAHKTLCPVCKKTAYSTAGIHPQCAIAQADPPKPRGKKPRAPHITDRIAVERAEAGTREDPRSTEIAVDEILGIPLRMIRLWIDTGAWPLPLSVCGGTLCFKWSDVECWLTTGAWPPDVHFGTRPRRPHAERCALLQDVYRTDHRGEDGKVWPGHRRHGERA